MTSEDELIAPMVTRGRQPENVEKICPLWSIREIEWVRGCGVKSEGISMKIVRTLQCSLKNEGVL
jgi:hypothetical protein